MKRLLFFFTTVMFFAVSFKGTAQGPGSASEPDTSAYPYWIRMMQDPNADFHATQHAFYRYWENRPIVPHSGYKVFKRWEYINEPRVQANGKLPAPGYVMQQYHDYFQSRSPLSPSGSWTLVGPTTLPINNTSAPNGMGRINAIAFHPTDANTFYIGSPSGGMWKTSDGGTTWATLTDANPTLGVSAIIVHPTTPNTILIGTGDRDADDAPGLGVYISTDGGSTWNPSNSGMGNQTVGMMLLHPSNYSILLAATSGGIYKSTDGGSTWTLKSGIDNFKDIKFKPGDPTIVYATASGNFYRSTNTGDSWTQITSGILTGARMVIGVSPNQPGYVYLLQSAYPTPPFVGLLRSTDSGLNFSTQSTTPNIMGYECDGSGTGNQTFYDLCITVDPNNANIIYAGGVNIWKSTDGGVTWSASSNWIGSAFGGCAASVHADQHCFVWAPVNGYLYNGDDGGIYRTTDGGSTWTDLSSGIAISQIYKIGQSALSEPLVMNGYQDNGTASDVGTTFTTVIGGDGTECIVDYTDENYRYGCYVNGSIRRSTGGSFSLIATSSNGITETGPWVTPYILHNTDPNTMFAGFKNVWRTNNVKAPSPGSVTWSAISTGESSYCGVVRQSPSNPDFLYVSRGSVLKRSENANATPASAVTWTTCTSPDGSTITDIAVHPTNPNILYVTTGYYYVWKSTDKGSSWSDISGSLPFVAYNCLVYDKNSNEGLYVGTQIGVFYKNSSMPDWIPFSTGLPVVDVRELEIYYGSDYPGTSKIKAATYGRGQWSSDLIETGSVLNPTNFTATTVGGTEIDLAWIKNPSNNNVIIAYNTSATFGVPLNGNPYTAGNVIPGGGTVIYNGSATSYNHISLTPSTTYYYKIWSYNGSTFYSVGTDASATTFCTLITSFPWIEGFEHSGSMPSCWTQEYVNGTDAWQIATSGISGHPSGPHTGAYLARFRYVTYANEGFTTKLVSPPINLTGLSNPVLRFWHTQELWGYQDQLRVYYRTTTTGSWNLLATYTSSIASWTQENIPLPNASSTYYIAFEGTEYAGYGVCLDDVAVTSGPLVWNGTGNWTDYTKWTPPYLPALFDDAVINAGTCTVNSNISCNNITVNTGAAISVNPANTITLNGTMTLNP